MMTVVATLVVVIGYLTNEVGITLHNGQDEMDEINK